MKTSPFRYLRFSLLLLSSFGLVNAPTAAPVNDLPGRNISPTAIASAHRPLDFDEVAASLPRDLAPIPAVVIAQVNIAMHQARQRAEQKLCAGRWTPRGTKAQEIGPLLPDVQSSATASNESWVYRSFRTPENLGCGQVTRSYFFQEVSRHLPAWITVRPATQVTAYRQGIAIGAAQPSIVATR